MPQSISLFRENLLKNFMLCYGNAEYKDILKQFEAFVDTKDDNIPVSLQSYLKKDGSYDVEGFLLEMNNKSTENLNHLSLFFTKIMLIPYSNTFVERMFSHSNNIEDDKRNLLEVTSVNSIM